MVITSRTRNAVVGQPARGFESHLFRRFRSILGVDMHSDSLKSDKKRFLWLLSAFLLLFSFLPPTVTADEPAADITSDAVVTGNGYSDFRFLFDGNLGNFSNSAGNADIRFDSKTPIGGIYIIFDLEYGEYIITDNDTAETASVGKYSYLHDYIDLSTCFTALPDSITIRFNNGTVRLSEIMLFSSGAPPDYVQIWQPPLEGRADIVLFSTHSDDDQLFFAGLLPLYAGQKGLNVQVVYLTDHRNATNRRAHEMVNGLWAVGVRNYPVLGPFADFRIDDREKTYERYRNMGISESVLLEYVVRQVRRFRPQVAVTHDINGEYGHGMHRVYADLLIKSLDVTADASQYPESAQMYGTWEIPKLYIHLYTKNKVVIDYDQPLDRFGGMTAFQVSQKLGYPCHITQQGTWYTGWLNGTGGNRITRASQISSYNPCYFGLYRSTVGPDMGQNDFMEHIVPYAEQERIARENYLRQLRRDTAFALAKNRLIPEPEKDYSPLAHIALCVASAAVILWLLYLTVSSKRNRRHVRKRLRRKQRAEKG